MTNLYNPAASTITGNGLFRLDFLATAPDVGNIIPVNYTLVRRLTIIAFVAAKVLRLLCRRLWSLNDSAIQDDFQLSYVVPIRPGYDDRQRDATLFHQQMAFASFFFPGPSGSDQPPLVPEVLWSWRYQDFATTRICPPFHHIQPTRLATWPEKLRPFPTAENRHGRNWDCRKPLSEELSIVCQCEEHRQCFKDFAIIQRLSATAFFPDISFTWVPGRLR